ncbi:MAG: ergothioneine biosynthesis protein EgtB [Chloroflexota bacterium]
MTTNIHSSDRERTRERPDRKAELRARLEDARARTWQLIDSLSDEDTRKQHSPLMSPLVWDVAHIGNFEELWLVKELGNLPSVDPLFDQIYDAFKNPRREREKLPLLDRNQCHDYLAAIRMKALRHLDEVDLSTADPLTKDGYVFEMIAQHEYQHNETMLATLQIMDDPGYQPDIPLTRKGEAPANEMVVIDAGPFSMGTRDRVVAYDNERPAHEVWLPSYWIDTTPVTNAAYDAFIRDSGYERPELWAPEGVAWLQETQARAPQFWQHQQDAWRVNRFGHWQPLNPLEPVQHVCFWEADAFARWAGKRLPTEAEWEKAASWDPTRQSKRIYPWGDEPPTRDHANLDQYSFGPSEVGAYPRGMSAYGCHQMIGDVWEWVNSDFMPYPGFEAFPYKEYSEVFFGTDYKMLRGGSWAVRPGAIRNTFRNWDYPIRRQIFSGFRCAKDAR